MSRLRTPEEVRAEFARNGVSITEWATAKGLNVSAVYHVLRKETQGTRGEAHRAAVELGLKEGNVVRNAGEVVL